MRRTMVTFATGVLFAGLSGTLRAGDAPPASSTFASINVKATQANAAPGGLVSVEAFVSNAQDLAVFQLQLGATGGEKGTLTLEGITVAKERPDFVFGTAEVLDAVDMNQGRVGALRYTGGSNVAKPVYLATFNFRASPDALGTFKINLRAGDESFLNDSAAVLIPHKKGADAEVIIGKPTPTRVEPRSRK